MMRISLRLKLTLVSLLLLLIPLIGFRFSDLIKQDLVESRKKTMLFSARTVSSALGAKAGLFDKELFHALDPDKDLYTYKLSNPMRINGKIDDWRPQLKEAEEFGKEHLLFSTVPYLYKSLHYKHLVGIRGNYLYALFIVTDDNIVYRNANSLHLDRSDHLQIGIMDSNSQMQRYLLTSDKPGWVNGFLISKEKNGNIAGQPEPRIQGVWKQSEDGYILEIRIAMDLIGPKIGFAIADVDDERTREVTTLIGTATTESADKLGWLLSQSTTIENLLKSFNRPYSRVLIIDTNRRIRASYGSLATENELEREENSLMDSVGSFTYSLFSPLYNFFTTPFSTKFSPMPPQPTTLDIVGTKEALGGKSLVTSYFPPEHQVEIMAAIVPLFEDNNIVGAVVVEQTTNSILALQNRVIEESLTFTILAFFGSGIGLLLFASRISSRIRNLGNQASAAINDSGQIVAAIKPLNSRDEIGELSRTLTSMLNQLKVQTEFREKMADNLEHEIRTPLAGISASLKNMEQEWSDPPERIRDYLNWALKDVERLDVLLSAVRDATNLQEALTRDIKENFDLTQAIAVWLEYSWQQAFPVIDFLFQKPPSSLFLHGDPGRIKQMLDKLIENAISFHKSGTPIEIKLKETVAGIVIEVINDGPPIPPEQQNQIFGSMVSLRPQKDNKPHLGLGLFIVYTIVEHHQGTISAGSLGKGREGAVFTVTLPIK